MIWSGPPNSAFAKGRAKPGGAVSARPCQDSRCRPNKAPIGAPGGESVRTRSAATRASRRITSKLWIRPPWSAWLSASRLRSEKSLFQRAVLSLSHAPAARILSFLPPLCSSSWSSDRLRFWSTWYDSRWASRVRAQLDILGIESQILAPTRSTDETTTFLGPVGQLQRNLSVLSSALGPTATPCTACYNSKVLMIQQEFGSMSPAPVVAFGHHASDAAASLLKSAFMFIDRWDLGNETYDRDRFRAECVKFGDQLLSGDEGLIDRLDELSRNRLVQPTNPLCSS